MKKQILGIASLFVAITINAQTIALHSSTGVQIIKGNTALATAYTAAQNGDTLYLSGHTFTPPAAFDKKLMIFGAGHYVDSTLATGKTIINGNFVLNENADLFYLEGVEIVSSILITTNHSVNNVTIKRCKINGTFSAEGDLSNPTTNLALINNVFVGNIDLLNAQNVLISNNIIDGGILNTNGNLINNNIILGAPIYCGWGCSMTFLGDNNQLNNNYFSNVYLTTSNGNTFRNSLCASNSPNYGANPTIINSYVNVPTSSAFVNFTGSTFSYLSNFHLQNPATYVGTDGTQVGIYGGTFPYKEGAVPLNPHIQIKNIASTTDANGNLQIQIQVGAQND